MAVRIRYGILAAFLMVGGLLAGCIDLGLGPGTRQTTQLYTLTAADPTSLEAADSHTSKLAIGVGPVTLPAYLDRSQILVRVGPRQLEALPFAQWAEPLEENVARVLVTHLAARTGSQAVYRYPWPQHQAPPVQLHLTVERFDAGRSGEAVLVVFWGWRDGEGNPLTPAARSVYRQPVAGNRADDLVAAMSRLIEDFSRAVSRELGRLPL